MGVWTMPRYDRNYISRRARELGFVRDTLEKVIRLADILQMLNTNPILKNSLALKGGTAINLTIFDLPRLSVDIDLDYLFNNSREEMLLQRGRIRDIIDRYMLAEGYTLNQKSKAAHSLDSWVYDYTGVSGNRDNIKIEINYSLRAHLFPAEERPVMTAELAGDYQVKTLSVVEIYAGKINALFNRAAVRDLYDVHQMMITGLFDAGEYSLLRKAVVFYAAITAREAGSRFQLAGMDAISHRQVKTDLLPVLRSTDRFDLEYARQAVRNFVAELMVLTAEEQRFLEVFRQGSYQPDLLFEDEDILQRIQHHPMALWKTRNMKKE